MTTATAHRPPWPPPVPCRPYGMVEFRAMASPCRIVTDDRFLAERGREIVADLERRWSRFLPDSEVSAVNSSGGAVHTVSAETFRLFEVAELARTATAGRFNPFVLDRLLQLGDGVDRPDAAGQPAAAVLPSPDVLLLERVPAVQIPSGAGFDPGGIGKGLAGDLVAERLVAEGATSVHVELGGDVRLVGRGWRSAEWRVDVRDPVRRRDVIAGIVVAEGAVATSSVLGRRWRLGSAPMHHIVDPWTGLPSETDLVAVTAVSSELWWAEVVAKVALMSGSAEAPSLMAELGTSGLLVMRDGRILRVGGAP